MRPRPRERVRAMRWGRVARGWPRRAARRGAWSCATGQGRSGDRGVGSRGLGGMGLGGGRLWSVRYRFRAWLPCGRLLFVGAIDARGLVGQARRQAVVLGEIARRDLADPQLGLEPVGGLLGDVFGERAGLMARFEDAQDCLVREGRSEEHTSELQSRENLVCRLLLEIKKPT